MDLSVMDCNKKGEKDPNMLKCEKKDIKSTSHSDYLFEQLLNTKKNLNNDSSIKATKQTKTVSNETSKAKVSMKSFFGGRSVSNTVSKALCVTNEKGTMTDPSLSKLKQKNKKVVNLGSILKGVTENKADNKVPLVILSRSSNSIVNDIEKKNSRVSKIQPNFTSCYDFSDSDSETGDNPSQESLSKFQRTSLKGSSNENDIFDSDSSMEETSSRPPSEEPDFKGFPSANAGISISKKKSSILDQSIASSIQLPLIKESSKNVSTDKNNKMTSIEMESPSLDHSYSHGSSKKEETIVAPNSSNESSEFRFLNRSVYNNTSDQKRAPDILLHKDKINILRQMSQIFNDEKRKSPEPFDISSWEENQAKKSFVQSPPEKNSCIEDSQLNESTPEKVAEQHFVVNRQKSPAANNKTVMIPTKGKTSTNLNVSNTVNPTLTKNKSLTGSKIFKSSKRKVTKNVAEPTKSGESSLSELNSTENAESVNEIGSEKLCANSNNTEKQIEPITAISGKSISPPLPDIDLDNKKNEDKDLVPINVENKYENESHAKTEANVYLVSSHIMNKCKVIKVKSYVGARGEDIDIIDGFTFASFDTEEDMDKYAFINKSRKGKIKSSKFRQKFRKKAKGHGFIEYVVDDGGSSKDVNMDSSVKPPNQVNLAGVGNDQSNSKEVKSRENLNEDDKFLNIPPIDDKIKSIEITGKKVCVSNDVQPITEPSVEEAASSAFASDDLDQFLDQNSQLKISFMIPSCKSTEEGVTRYDEEGNPIVPKKKKETESEFLPPILSTTNDDAMFKVPFQPDEVPKRPKKAEFKMPNNYQIQKWRVKYSAKTHTLKQKYSNNKSLFVKRKGGALVPLNSVFSHKKSLVLQNEKEDSVEMIYVYSSGRLLKLAGSLTKINPSNSNSVKARVVLPIGHQKILNHSKEVIDETVKPVEINEDMAKFALSALVPPNIPSSDVIVSEKKETEISIDSSNKENCGNSEINSITGLNAAVTKPKIVDILASKLAINDGMSWSSSLVLPEGRTEVTCTGSSDAKNLGISESCAKDVSPSKIMWTQEDVLKKSTIVHTAEKSKAYSKNFRRFPSLSREMKRLNMNFVTYEKGPDEAVEEESSDTQAPCNFLHCKYGCICESLKCKKIAPEHCGRPECMFECSCRFESWKNSGQDDLSLNSVSILHLDKEHQEGLAVKEKDFKKTIVQSGSDFYMLGGDRKKRDIKVPERFRDTVHSSLVTDQWCDSTDSTKTEEQRILPLKYKEHIKNFSVEIPRYDIRGVSIWCMLHSCYDCLCITDPNFSSSVGAIEPNDELVSDASENRRSPNEEKMIPYAMTSKTNYIIEKVKVEFDHNLFNHWTFKYWIHDGEMHCARTAGYRVKTFRSKNTAISIGQYYTHPYTKYPYILGRTLLKRNAKRDVAGKYNSRKVINNNIAKILTKNTANQKDQTETNEQQSALHEAMEMGTNIVKTASPIDKRPINASNTKETNGEERLSKKLSFHEMIEEEETRGELELDLSNRTAGRTMLVMESRFRKLINMFIIGIVSLNKVGRCIVDTVNDSDDLVKMRRIQRFINDRTIDVGPMRDLFYPSIIENRTRYVMLRCDSADRWEIIGLVQRKDQKFIPSFNKCAKKSLAKSPVTKPQSIGSSHPVIDPSNDDSAAAAPAQPASAEKIDPKPDDCIIDMASALDGLPQIASVHSASDPNMMELIGPLSKLPPSMSSTKETLQSPAKKFKLSNECVNSSCSTSKNSIISQPNSAASAQSQSHETMIKNTPTNVIGTSSRRILFYKTQMDSNVTKDGVRMIILPSRTSQNQAILLPTPKYSVAIPQTSNFAPKILNYVSNNIPPDVSGEDTPPTRTISPTPNVSICSTGPPRIHPTGSFTEIPHPIEETPKTLNLSNLALSAACNPATSTSVPSTTTFTPMTASRGSLVPENTPQLSLAANDLSILKVLSNLSASKLDITPRKGITVEKLDSQPPKKLGKKSNKNSGLEVESCDIKCITVQNRERCSAVDLSINFRSVRVHWLSGTIKKCVLTNIYRMSKESNIPIYLTVKNPDNQSVFYGMYCSDSNLAHPILVLGSRIEVVKEWSTMNERFLFRSNLTRYFIRESSGELSSYTYDAKGTNMVQLATKSKGKEKSPFTGKKIPVQVMRLWQNLISVTTPTLSPTDDSEVYIINPPNNLKSVPDENPLEILHDLKSINDNPQHSPISSSQELDSKTSEPSTPHILDSLKQTQFSEEPKGIEPQEVVKGILPESDSVEDIASRSISNFPCGSSSWQESSLTIPTSEEASSSESPEKSITERETAKILLENNNSKDFKSFGIACFSKAAEADSSFDSAVSHTKKLDKNQSNIEDSTSPSSEMSCSSSTEDECDRLVMDEIEEHIDIMTDFTPALLPEDPEIANKWIQALKKRKLAEEASQPFVPNKKIRTVKRKTKRKSTPKSAPESVSPTDKQKLGHFDKHNITERIRRKRLAIMFKNLQEIVTGNTKPFLPKKQILEETTAVVKELNKVEGELIGSESVLKIQKESQVKNLVNLTTDLPPEVSGEISLWCKDNLVDPGRRKDIEDTWVPVNIDDEDVTEAEEKLLSPVPRKKSKIGSAGQRKKIKVLNSLTNLRKHLEMLSTKHQKVPTAQNQTTQPNKFKRSFEEIGDELNTGNEKPLLTQFQKAELTETPNAHVDRQSQ